MLIATYSMVALAASNKPVGELIVTGDKVDDAVPVTVNGEAAKTGRTVFSSSSIVTPESLEATINFGKAGRIELGPNTTFVLTGDGDAISGDITAGSVTVLSAAQSVNVKTLSGEIVALNAGETATASAGKAPADHRDPVTGKCIDDNNNGKEECGLKAIPPWAWAAIIGGVIAVVIIATTSGGNEANPISPVR